MGCDGDERDRQSEREINLTRENTNQSNVRGKREDMGRDRQAETDSLGISQFAVQDSRFKAWVDPAA